MSSKIAVIKDEYMYLLKYIYSIIFVKLACCINILCDIIIPLLVISDVTSHIHKKQKQYFDFIPNLYVEGAYALKFLLPIYYHSSEMRGLGYVTPVQNVLI